jgi:hypothetical protein
MVFIGLVKRVPSSLPEDWYIGERKCLKGKLFDEPVMIYLKFKHSNDNMFIYFADNPKKLALFLIAHFHKNLGSGYYFVNCNAGAGGFIKRIWQGQISEKEINSVRKKLDEINEKKRRKLMSSNDNFIDGKYLEKYAPNLDNYENSVFCETRFSRHISKQNLDFMESSNDEESTIDDLRSFFDITRNE